MHSIGDAWEGVVVVGSSGFKPRVWEGSAGRQTAYLFFWLAWHALVLLTGMVCTSPTLIFMVCGLGLFFSIVIITNYYC